jgi:hypothetical protein
VADRQNGRPWQKLVSFKKLQLFIEFSYVWANSVKILGPRKWSFSSKTFILPPLGPRCQRRWHSCHLNYALAHVPTRVLLPPPYVSVTLRIFPGLRWPQLKDDRSHPSSVKVQNEWIYTSIPYLSTWLAKGQRYVSCKFMLSSLASSCSQPLRDVCHKRYGLQGVLQSEVCRYTWPFGWFSLRLHCSWPTDCIGSY